MKFQDAINKHLSILTEQEAVPPLQDELPPLSDEELPPEAVADDIEDEGTDEPDESLGRLNDITMIRDALFVSPEDVRNNTTTLQYAKLISDINQDNLDEIEKILQQVLETDLPDVEAEPTGPGVV